MDQRGWLVWGALGMAGALAAAGCRTQPTQGESVRVVPARQALGPYRSPLPPPRAVQPNKPVRPATNPPQPLVPASRHPEWDVAHPRAWHYIVIHHSDTERGNAATFDRFHRARGWENGLGYHFVIGNGTGSGDGQVEVGGRWVSQIQGAHAGVALYNEEGIGICLVGNFEERRPTPRQLAALVELVNHLAAAYHIPRERILRHGDVKDTKCPGRFFPFNELFRR